MGLIVAGKLHHCHECERVSSWLSDDAVQDTFFHTPRIRGGVAAVVSSQSATACLPRGHSLACKSQTNDKERSRKDGLRKAASQCSSAALVVTDVARALHQLASTSPGVAGVGAWCCERTRMTAAVAKCQVACRLRMLGRRAGTKEAHYGRP